MATLAGPRLMGSRWRECLVQTAREGCRAAPDLRAVLPWRVRSWIGKVSVGMEKRRQKRLRAHIKEFVLPPITDGLVLGRASPIGHVAVGRALSLLSTTAFEHIEIDDDVISDILIRKAILRKIPAAELKTFILDEIKPAMGAEEILHLALEVELFVDQKLG